MKTLTAFTACCVLAAIACFAMAEPVMDFQFTTITYQVDQSRFSMAVGTGTTITYQGVMPGFNPYPRERESVFDCDDGSRMCAVIRTTREILPEDEKGTPVQFESTLEKIKIYTPGDLSKTPSVPSIEITFPNSDATVQKGPAKVSMAEGEVLIAKVHLSVSPRGRKIATWAGLKSKSAR